MDFRGVSECAAPATSIVKRHGNFRSLCSVALVASTSTNGIGIAFSIGNTAGTAVEDARLLPSFNTDLWHTGFE